MLDYNYPRQFSYNSPLNSRFTTHANSTATPDPPRYNTPYSPQDNNYYPRRYYENTFDSTYTPYRSHYRGYRAESASPGQHSLEQRQTGYNRYTYNSKQQFQLSDYTDIDCIIEPQGGKGGLYLGNINGAKNVFMLKGKQIGAVVTIIANSGIRYPAEIEHYLIEMDDAEDENISMHFDSASQFITQQLSKTNVFVHCYAGISRSSSIVIAYIMNKNKWDFNQAFQFVKSKRKIIDPNNGFVRQLKQYEYKTNSYSKMNCYTPERFMKTSYDQINRKNGYNYDQPYNRSNFYNRFQY